MSNIQQNREEALQQVKMFQSNDWELIEETPSYFLLKKTSASFGKHLLLFIFTWWTLGVANLVYHYSAKKTKKIIK